MGKERIRDRQEKQEAELDWLVTKKAKKRQAEKQLSYCIHTTGESMRRRGMGGAH